MLLLSCELLPRDAIHCKYLNMRFVTQYKERRGHENSIKPITVIRTFLIIIIINTMHVLIVIFISVSSYYAIIVTHCILLLRVLCRHEPYVATRLIDKHTHKYNK